MPTMQELLENIPQVGRVEWIGVSPRARGQIQSLQIASVSATTGLDDDYHARSGRSKRQITLIQAEHLPVVSQMLGGAPVRPDQLRRNIVVSGINLTSLRRQQFRIGEVLLEGTGPCAPCSRMEENLGPGGYHAMRGHGGITAKVLTSGTITVGDAIVFVARSKADEAD